MMPEQLYRVIDEYILEPVREIEKPFRMHVEYVFSIKGRGTVMTDVNMSSDCNVMVIPGDRSNDLFC